MHKPDFDEFRKLLDECALVFSKEKPDDLRVQVFWKALRDLDLSTVKRCTATHIRWGKFFPKPVDLRPKDQRPPIDKSDSDGKGKAALEMNQRNWDELLRIHPARARTLLAHARIARIYATEHESSPIYAQARHEELQLASRFT